MQEIETKTVTVLILKYCDVLDHTNWGAAGLVN